MFPIVSEGLAARGTSVCDAHPLEWMQRALPPAAASPAKTSTKNDNSGCLRCNGSRPRSRGDPMAVWGFVQSFNPRPHSGHRPGVRGPQSQETEITATKARDGTAA